MIKGILFDFDGTLADTVGLIIATFEHACASVLGTVPPRAQIVATFGLPLPQALLALAGREELVEQMRLAYKSFNDQNHDVMIRPIDGVENLLQQLKARGIKIAIVTSKKPPMLQRGLNCLQLTQYIDATIALGATAETKPHAAPMLAGCAALGLCSSECLCVGDSPFDLQSGHNAGVRTVAVHYTAFPWEKILTEGRPDYIIERPADLLELVKKLNS